MSAPAYERSGGLLSKIQKISLLQQSFRRKVEFYSDCGWLWMKNEILVLKMNDSPPRFSNFESNFEQKHNFDNMF